ncbi:MAG TPA: response regulator, partial [Polyangiaceae bacterium]|nr:response regulator [Polyangiaceae bacterium]
MATKVLVFESDGAFANELTTEFQALGCEVDVVDDGNIGLQMAASHRPDLILLSIELPRTNGFSVCNRIKKDPSLKDIPLIIMSSMSNKDTFEQHRRLRTRAEDYLHKPIAFADLLQRVQQFLEISPSAGPSSLEDAIIIDDDISFEENDDEDLHTVMMNRSSLEAFETVEPKAPATTAVSTTPSRPRPSSRAPSQMEVDDLDVDEFADAAFDRLLDAPEPSDQKPSQTALQTPSQIAADTMSTEVPPMLLQEGIETRPATIPALPDIHSEELERLRNELERMQTKAVRLEQDLSASRADNRRLEEQVRSTEQASAEVERLQRQIDELKSRASIPPGRTGTVSSREFLDLREALNNKDKEILALRDQMSQKEKELLAARDVSLSLEREKADTQDKLLEFEKQALDFRMSIDRLTVQHGEEQQKSADLQARLNASLQQIEEQHTRITEQEALRLRESEEHAATLETQKREANQALDNLRGERETLSTRITELEKDLSDRNNRITGLENDIKARDSRITELEGNVGDRDNRIVGLENDIKTRDSRITELEGIVGDRDNRITGLENDIKTRDSRITELEGIVGDRDNRI